MTKVSNEFCPDCAGRMRHRKIKPYGLTNRRTWCDGCDRNKVSAVVKSKERNKWKREELTRENLRTSDEIFKDGY